MECMGWSILLCPLKKNDEKMSLIIYLPTLSTFTSVWVNASNIKVTNCIRRLRFSSNSQSLANYSHTSSTSSSSYSTQSPVKHVNNTPPTSGFVVEKSRRGDFYTFSATFPDGNILYFKCWYSEDETLQVCEPTDNDGWTGYRKPCGHVDIPSYLEYAGTKYKVTEIGPCAFENCNSK